MRDSFGPTLCTHVNFRDFPCFSWLDLKDSVLIKYFFMADSTSWLTKPSVFPAWYNKLHELQQFHLFLFALLLLYEMSHWECYKMNGYTLKGNNCLDICLSSEWGSNSFTSGVDPILEGFCCPGKEIGGHRNCLPLKMVDYLLWWCIYTL